MLTSTFTILMLPPGPPRYLWANPLVCSSMSCKTVQVGLALGILGALLQLGWVHGAVKNVALDFDALPVQQHARGKEKQNGPELSAQAPMAIPARNGEEGFMLNSEVMFDNDRRSTSAVVVDHNAEHQLSCKRGEALEPLRKALKCEGGASSAIVEGEPQEHDSASLIASHSSLEHHSPCKRAVALDPSKKASYNKGGAEQNLGQSEPEPEAFVNARKLILGSITPQHVSLLEVVLEVQKHMFGEGRYVDAAKSLHQELSDEFL